MQNKGRKERVFFWLYVAFFSFCASSSVTSLACNALWVRHAIFLARNTGEEDYATSPYRATAKEANLSQVWLLTEISSAIMDVSRSLMTSASVGNTEH